MTNTYQLAEDLQTYVSEKPVRFRFCFPHGWSSQELASGSESCAAQVNGLHKGTCIGRVLVQVHHCSQSDAESFNTARYIQQQATYLESMGYRLTGVPALPCPPIPGFKRGTAYSPVATFNDDQFDTPVLVFVNDSLVVSIGLIGISRSEYPEWWAINKHAFEIVRDSIMIGDSVGSGSVGDTPAADCLPDAGEAATDDNADRPAAPEVSAGGRRFSFPDAGSVS